MGHGGSLDFNSSSTEERVISSAGNEYTGHGGSLDATVSSSQGEYSTNGTTSIIDISSPNDIIAEVQQLISSVETYKSSLSNTLTFPSVTPKELIENSKSLSSYLSKINPVTDALILNLNSIIDYINSLIEANAVGDVVTTGSNDSGGSSYSGSSSHSSNLNLSDVPGDNTSLPASSVVLPNADTNNSQIDNSIVNSDENSSVSINDEASVTSPNQSGGENSNNTSYTPTESKGQVILKDETQIVDENGNVIDTTNKNNYQVYDTKYDENGNVVAVRISKDGQPEQWINVTDGHAVFIETENNGIYTIEGDNINVYDADGNIAGTIGSGDHKVYDIMYDENGNAIAYRITPDGESAKWIDVSNGINNGTFTYNNQVGNYYLSETTGTLNIYDESGNVIGQVNGGNYQVYDVMYDENSNPYSIRISKNGAPERWIKIFENGQSIGEYTSLQSVIKPIVDNNSNSFMKLFTTKSLAIGGIIGVLAIGAGAGLYIKNKKGEQISNIDSGEYNIYDVKKDANGQVTEAQISPPGDDEYWVNV